MTISLDPQKIFPAPAGHGWQYVSLTCGTSLLCLMAVYLGSHLLVGDQTTPLIIAPMGAAAVLMFAAPGSPMAKPWSFAAGNLISALIGVSCYQWLPSIGLAGPCAVAISIASMHLLRCQHPPGGATALLAVIGGDDIHQLGYHYVVMPVAINVGIFLLGVAAHRQLLRQIAQRDQTNARLLAAIKAERQTPSHQHNLPPAPYDPEDLSKALASLGTYLDISKEQLDQVFKLTLHHARSRHLQSTQCVEQAIGADATTHFGTSLLDAWQQMQQQDVEQLVVLSPSGNVEGVLGLSDLLDLIPGNTNDEQLHSSQHLQKQLHQKLIEAITPSGTLHSERPEVVGQLMREIDQVGAEQSLQQALTETRTNSIAVIDAQGQFCGVIVKQALLEN